MRIFARSSALLMPRSPKNLMPTKPLFSATRPMLRAPKTFKSTPLFRARGTGESPCRLRPKTRPTRSPLSTCECRRAGMESKRSRRIWKEFPDLQIVICTAYSDYSWDEIAKSIGNTDQDARPQETVRQRRGVADGARALEKMAAHSDGATANGGTRCLGKPAHGGIARRQRAARPAK